MQSIQLGSWVMRHAAENFTCAHFACNVIQTQLVSKVTQLEHTFQVHHSPGGSNLRLLTCYSCVSLERLYYYMCVNVKFKLSLYHKKLTIYVCTFLHIIANLVLLQIYSKGLESSWVGYMAGQVEFNTRLFNSNTREMIKLVSRDDYNKHAIFTGGNHNKLINMYLIYIYGLSQLMGLSITCERLLFYFLFRTRSI